MTRRYPDFPVPAAGAVVLGSNGVLLVRRRDPPRENCWSLPGGAQEITETIYESAIREVKEETGLDIRILGLIDVVDSITFDDEGALRFHYTVTDFAARVTGGQLMAGDDAIEARWFSPDQVSELDMWSETHRIIREAISRFGASIPELGSTFPK